MEHFYLCRGFVRGTWRRVSLLGTLRDMSGKALEGEHLSLYRGSVRGTWREGSHTEDSNTHVIEGSGKGAFHFTGASYGKSKGI
jgi:hypothetical protein